MSQGGAVSYERGTPVKQVRQLNPALGVPAALGELRHSGELRDGEGLEARYLKAVALAGR